MKTFQQARTVAVIASLAGQPVDALQPMKPEQLSATKNRQYMRPKSSCNILLPLVMSLFVDGRFDIRLR